MRLLSIFTIILFLSCSEKEASTIHLFTDLTIESGIRFHNNLIFTQELNPYTYRNFYNGAGVAIGDINNDGLADIYFSGNQVDNKLFLNKGNFFFEDITLSAGVACKDVWSTGVTFVDLNSDGYLDIYVCKSGNPDTPNRNNELFINNGDLTFTERSKEYGLDIVGLSVQAAFFDYDKDGDLDCYLLTNSFKSVGNYDLVKDQRNIPDSQNGGNKFLLNDGGKFRDFSEEANIFRSNIGFGLGITLGDFNDDDWQDVFISNDFFERDYLYINNQKGAFVESLTDYFESISMGSMGADFADLDGDRYPELFVTEMLPDSLKRRKSKMIYESWDRNQISIQNGYHYQYPRNVLHKRVGNNRFVEVGRIAGVAASEWSWGALLFDMDNDGLRDIFIANGIYKDLLDRDYLAYTGAEDNVRKMIKEEKNAILKLIDLMPRSQFSNYAFRNVGDLKFNNTVFQWGLSEPMYSSGSAYGDLDNDGDLDLVINNLNGPSKVFRNNTDSSVYKSITVALSSRSKNTGALGSQISVYTNGKIFIADNFVTRGYQSSVHSDVVIGLGQGIDRIDSMIVNWPDNSYSVFYNLPVNNKIQIIQEDCNKMYGSLVKMEFKAAILWDKWPDIVFKHRGSELVDFNRDRLLPMMYSNETPFIMKGDIDGDAKDDIYVGGGKNQPGVFIDLSKPEIVTRESKILNHWAMSEETKGTFFDADNDDDLDFFMATGGRSYSNISNAQQDRLFINVGYGNYEESINALPTNSFSTSVVLPIDFDNDADMDLFVGERFDPFIYGKGGNGYLWQNDGIGHFSDVTSKYASEFTNIGMITDAVSVDINADGWNDLVIVGDWMPIFAFINHKGTLINESNKLGWKVTEGWWHTIVSADLNKDGTPDFVIGNQGLNSFFKAGDRMYVNDFDKNGSDEQIFCTQVDGKYFPIIEKDDFLSQIPSLKKSLLYYKVYANKSIDDLFPSETLTASRVFQVNQLSSIALISGPNGYELLALPLEAQFSPIYGLLISDLDGDGVMDLLAGGNQFLVKPQYGRQDASQAWFFKGKLTNSQFEFLKGVSLGITGQIRDIEEVSIGANRFILFTKYDSELEIFKLRN